MILKFTIFKILLHFSSPTSLIQVLYMTLYNFIPLFYPLLGILSS